MPAGFPDIAAELSQIAEEAATLGRAVEVDLGAAGLTSREADWLFTQGLAAGVENVYSGCERVMVLLAKTVDGEPVAKDDGWHRALLGRLAQPRLGGRGPVITAELFHALDELRSFRHRRRNTYGLQLDRDKVVERARMAAPTVARFGAEVEAFLEEWSRTARPED